MDINFLTVQNTRVSVWHWRVPIQSMRKWGILRQWSRNIRMSLSRWFRRWASYLTLRLQNIHDASLQERIVSWSLKSAWSIFVRAMESAWETTWTSAVNAFQALGIRQPFCLNSWLNKVQIMVAEVTIVRLKSTSATRILVSTMPLVWTSTIPTDVCVLQDTLANFARSTLMNVSHNFGTFKYLAIQWF